MAQVLRGPRRKFRRVRDHHCTRIEASSREPGWDRSISRQPRLDGFGGEVVALVYRIQRSMRRIPEIQSVKALGGRTLVVPAEPQIQSQLRSYLPVVLKERAPVVRVHRAAGRLGHVVAAVD